MGLLVLRYLLSAARVRGPVAPYPVLSGVPVQIILSAHWNFCSAAKVRFPKKPEMFSASRYPSLTRIPWSIETSGPRDPARRVRVIAELSTGGVSQKEGGAG